MKTIEDSSRPRALNDTSEPLASLSPIAQNKVTLVSSGYAEPWKHTWAEKLNSFLFPVKHVPFDFQTEFQWKDCITCNIQVHISFWDRVKLLFTGRANIAIETMCEFEVGKTKANSEFNVVWK